MNKYYCLHTVAAFAMLFIAITVRAQSPATGQILGHGYVDLGLSVMWATCNIGANSPSDCGDYFAWGEAETKAEYTEENSATQGKSDNFIDAASANWGSAWRMPTLEECKELVDKDNCKWKWVTVGGHTGYMVKSKKNGNTIFLPAAGKQGGNPGIVEPIGECGSYWSSSLGVSGGGPCVIMFSSDMLGGVGWASLYDGQGLPIRPVIERK